MVIGNNPSEITFDEYVLSWVTLSKDNSEVVPLGSTRLTHRMISEHREGDTSSFLKTESKMKILGRGS